LLREAHAMTQDTTMPVRRVRPPLPLVPRACWLGWSRELAATSVVTDADLIPFGRLLQSAAPALAADSLAALWWRWPGRNGSSNTYAPPPLSRRKSRPSTCTRWASMSGQTPMIS
jgi:hypothetical protein